MMHVSNSNGYYMIAEIWSALTSYWNQYNQQPSDEFTSIETPHFGSKEWKQYFGLDVEDVELPKKMEQILESTSVIWPTKKVKDVYFACFIPKEAFENLKQISKDNHLLPPICKIMQSPAKSEWILISKQILPLTRKLDYQDQETALDRINHRPPTMFEAMVTVLALERLNHKPYPRPGYYTRCQEHLNDWPVAIGTGASKGYCISINDAMEMNGMAGVLKG